MIMRQTPFMRVCLMILVLGSDVPTKLCLVSMAIRTGSVSAGKYSMQFDILITWELLVLHYDRAPSSHLKADGTGPYHAVTRAFESCNIAPALCTEYIMHPLTPS